MRSLTIRLFILLSLIFPTIASATVASYAGGYSGTFSGVDHGTWTATISSAGSITATGVSANLGGSFSGSGQVSANGSLTMTLGNLSTGATFIGTINLSAGTVSGTWSNVNASGTWSGTRTTPVYGACGASDGVYYSSASVPTSLCSSGTAGTPSWNGNSWGWTCSSSNNTYVSCASIPLPYYVITVYMAGTGSGRVQSSSPPVPNTNTVDISCSLGTCTGSYTLGANVTLVATTSSGSTFSGWSGGGCSGVGDCIVAMGDDQAVTATFTANALPVNGICGTAHNGSFSSAPTIDLCSTGSPSTPTGTGPWYWNCNGSNGGSNAPCSATVTINQPSGPANDNFANRIPISSYATGLNDGATKEQSEPIHANNAGGKSVWWSWTAPSTGTVTINTTDSSFDTLLAIYVGTAVNALEYITSNDDAGGGATTSLVSFLAIAGQTYQIAVDGFSGASGFILLDVEASTPSVPSCTLTPSYQAISAGTSASLTASCANPATFVWGATPAGCPTFGGTGGYSTFSTAGSCTYSISNGAGGAASATVTVSASSSSLPDLFITGMSGTSTGIVGGQIYVSATVGNFGTGGVAAGAYSLGFYFSTDETITTADAISTACAMSALASGATSDCGGYITIPPGLPPGNYYLGAFADDQGIISEFSDANNTSAFPITLLASDSVAAAAVEFYKSDIDHYFMTAYTDEATSLDNNTAWNWVRTGNTFNIWLTQDVAPSNASPVCRFYGVFANGTMGSHFYTIDTDECEYVKNRTDWGWGYEGFAFYAVKPSSSACPSGTSPIYRVFNNGMGGAPNHRYTTSQSVVDTMVAQGWVSEGLVFCGND